MQNSRINLPTSAGLQAVGARVKKNSIVALVPIFQTSADVVLRRSRIEAHECVWEIVFCEVVLRWKIISLRLAALSYQTRQCIALMKMMRDRPHVVEEF